MQCPIVAEAASFLSLMLPASGSALQPPRPACSAPIAVFFPPAAAVQGALNTSFTHHLFLHSLQARKTGKEQLALVMSAFQYGGLRLHFGQ